MNRGPDSILSVYSDARAEYTKQLCVFLVPAYFQFFTDLLEKAKHTMLNEPKRALWQFQTYLNEIHDWNMEKVNNEIHTIQINSGCDYLEELLTAVFIAHTKVLTAIRLSSNNKKVEINIPKVEHFLFKALCEIAKLLWSSTYLFRDGIPGIEKQQNYRNIEQLINEGIIQAVRSLVPVKSILRDFVNNDNVGGDDDDESEDESQKPPFKDEIKDDKEENKMENNNTESAQHLSVPQPVSLVESSQPPSSQVPSDIPLEPSIKHENNTVINETNTTEVSLSSQDTTSSHLTPAAYPENIIVTPSEQGCQTGAPTIIIDDKPTVKFGEFNAMFDSDHPSDSEMVYDSKEDEVPDLEILDENGTPLSAGVDFDSLNENENDNEVIGESDYEELK